MGLDMYLNAKRYIWYSENELSEKLSAAFPQINGKAVKEVIVEAMYWRKANAIHKWFVDNVQGGNDDCRQYVVTREQLIELLNLILDVLKTKDTSKLAPKAGFFFGSTEIDDWYWEDLSQTAKELESVLINFDDKWDFRYQSSW